MWARLRGALACPGSASMLDSRQVVPNGPGKTSKGLSRNPKGHSEFASESRDDPCTTVTFQVLVLKHGHQLHAECLAPLPSRHCQETTWACSGTNIIALPHWHRFSVAPDGFA